MTNAGEVMRRVIVDRLYCLPDHCFIRQQKPCQEHEDLPESTKAALRDLTCDDLNALRPDLIAEVVESCRLKSEWARNYRRSRQEKAIP